jgi:hypothetical protein
MDWPASLNALLQLLPAKWFPSLLTLLRRVQQRLKPRANEGLYEMLEYEAVLELLDPRGRATMFKKRQRVKFLQDNVIAFLATPQFC